MADGEVGSDRTFRYGNGPTRSRRWFLKLTAAGTLGLYVSNAFGETRLAEAAPIPGGSLAPKQIPKFVQPLQVPGTMPTTSTPNQYKLAVRQFRQQMLPPGMPQTTVWSYVPTNQPGLQTTPSYTIEAVRGRPVTVTWVNGLIDSNGRYRPHLFPVDPTLHWANPPGGTTGRDCRPMFMTTPEPYTGPVPTVTHVHGLADSPDWSDGYAEAWFLPAANNIPAGYATVGSWYDFFRKKSGRAWAKGSATFVYPNRERPSTAWYHTHVPRFSACTSPASRSTFKW